MIKYELPYNFDPAYVQYFSEPEHSQFLPYVEFIYIPAWKDDCINTRLDVTFRGTYPKTYDDYVERIRDLQQLKIPICILMQKNGSMEVFKKYYDLGIRHFIMNDDVLAKNIAWYYADVWLALSVTRNLTFDEIVEKDYSQYNTIVLFYWFNRHLDKVRQLPKKYHYTIMCNNDCYWNCKWHDAHWWANGSSIEEYDRKAAAACKECGKYHMELRDSATILPEDLMYFDPYIYTYKLVDRIWPTEMIGNALEEYAKRGYGADPKHTEDFYNIDKPFEGTVI